MKTQNLLLLCLIVVSSAPLGCRLRRSGLPDAKEAGKTCPPEGSIEDAEDGDGQIQTIERRGGYLYTYTDEKGSTVQPAGEDVRPAEGGANGSAHALHMQGTITPGEDPYAGMGFSFVDPKAPYDASKYAGIAFLAKAAQGSARRVRFKLSDVNTDPSGKVCKDCYNDFGVDLELTNEWTRYALPFGALTQEPDWGDPRPPAVEPAKLIGVGWQVSTPGAYDIWVDDVAFSCR